MSQLGANNNCHEQDVSENRSNESFENGHSEHDWDTSFNSDVSCDYLPVQRGTADDPICLSDDSRNTSFGSGNQSPIYAPSSPDYHLNNRSPVYTENAPPSYEPQDSGSYRRTFDREGIPLRDGYDNVQSPIYDPSSGGYYPSYDDGSAYRRNTSFGSGNESPIYAPSSPDYHLNNRSPVYTENGPPSYEPQDSNSNRRMFDQDGTPPRDGYNNVRSPMYDPSSGYYQSNNGGNDNENSQE
ncbi:unnamed protein product [Caenorhabditis angaria]|uniref:Uncharacterized protein n=1 Tax=Caenorhabditis angaria TaxID=860376 RepID=A0A9P1N7W7_9PELO|nr:unnamed protein product [Caenorhabditis angaria]